MKHNILCFDLDGTLCTSVDDSDYTKAEPLSHAIKKVNDLYNNTTIVIFTGRGSSTGKDWTDFTKKQIDDWGLKYHELITNRKPTYDLIIDDKAINAADWRKINCGTNGVVAGAFDLIHPGYCKMFRFCKLHCDHLTVLLHEDPSLEREKLKPIHSTEERIEILSSIKYIDDIKLYRTEDDLYECLNTNKYNIRFLGNDYINNPYTGQDINMKVLYVNRDHLYSTTKLKEKIIQNAK